MNRREFVVTAAASLASTAMPCSAENSTATLEMDATKPGPRIPIDFTGLSYESAQLANPQFFSAENKPLIELFRQLTTSGNLRMPFLTAFARSVGSTETASCSRPSYYAMGPARSPDATLEQLSPSPIRSSPPSKPYSALPKYISAHSPLTFRK